MFLIQNSSGSVTAELSALLRLQKAQELLASSTFEIQDISQQVGYPDAQSFSKAFRRIYQISPSEYQKLHSGKSL